MSEDKHNELYEKVGKLTGLVESLADAQIHHRQEMTTELREMKSLLSENIKTMSSLKTTVATISGGIGTVVTLAITFIWNFVTGSHPK
jgi:hypothetical protein